MFLDGEVGEKEVRAFSFHIPVRLFLCCKVLKRGIFSFNG